MLDQTAHAHSAAPTFQLAPQLADLTAGCVSVEASLLHQRRGDSAGQFAADCTQALGVSLDRLVVRVGVETPEGRRVLPLGDGSRRHPALERQTRVVGVDLAVKNVGPEIDHPGRCQRLDQPQQVGPTLDRRGVVETACRTGCPPAGDEVVGLRPSLLPVRRGSGGYRQRAPRRRYPGELVGTGTDWVVRVVGPQIADMCIIGLSR